MTREEFLGRVAELLLASNVSEAKRLINLLDGHVEGEFAPGCGALSAFEAYGRQQQIDNNQKPTYGVCDLPVGHEGYHKDRHGRRWMNYPSSST